MSHAAKRNFEVEKGHACAPMLHGGGHIHTQKSHITHCCSAADDAQGYYLETAAERSAAGAWRQL